MAFKEMNMFYRIFQMFGAWYPQPTGIYGTLGFIGQVIRNSLFILSWCAEVVSVYLEGFRRSMNGSAFFLIISFVTVFEMVMIFLKRQETHCIMNMLEMSANSRSGWAKQYFDQRTEFAKKVVKIYQTTMIVIGLILYLGFPVLNELLELYGFQTMSLAVPFSELSIDGPYKKILEKLRTVWGIIWCLHGIIFFSCVHSMFFTFTLYTAAEIDLVCERIKRLSYIDDVEYYKVDKATKDGISLLEIIVHHQFVLKLSKKLINLFGLIFALENWIAAMSLCLNLITIRFETMKSSPGVIIIPALTMFSNVIQLTTVSYFGNYLTERSNVIYERLYELPWYKLPPSLRKTISIMSRQASMPTVIHYHGLARVTLENYAQLMNAAYSYFTVMSSLLDE